MIYYTFYHSPIGCLMLTEENRFLTGLYIRDYAIGENWEEDPRRFSEVFSWLDDYFGGNPKPVNFPIKADGTDFQKRVWKLLLEIPYGRTRTYGDIAEEIAEMLGKDQMSSRAVGQAVGCNPVSIIIPCHRVIGAGKRLTGYSGGLVNKIWLLRHEGREE